MELKIGRVVQIKSGGPNMTITGFLSKETGQQYEKGIRVAILKRSEENTNGYDICEWFDNKDSYKKNVFNIEILEVKKWVFQVWLMIKLQL